MKNYLISALLIVGFAVSGFAATVDRTETILATGTNNNAGTAVVSQSPTNEYALAYVTAIGAVTTTNANGIIATTNVISFGTTFYSAPVQIDLVTGISTSNTVTAITTSGFSVINAMPFVASTNNVLFIGLKRLGKKQP